MVTEHDQKAARRRRNIVRGGVTILAAGLFAAHRHWPQAQLKLDDIEIALVVLALLPWTMDYITGVELFGIKLELGNLAARIGETEGLAASADQKAETALTPRSAHIAHDPGHAIDEGRQGTAIHRLDELAKQYDEVRRNTPASDERTAAMDAIVRGMIEVAPDITAFPYRERLLDTTDREKRGGRLAAYALLWANPSRDYMNDLVKSVVSVEDKPFGQFWGIEAVRRGCEAGIRPDAESCKRLTDYGRRQDVRTDRAAAARIALKACRCGG